MNAQNLIGLGRLAPPDRDQDEKYLLPRRSKVAENVRRKVWTAATVLDQGNTSQCVAFSTRQWLRASPVRQEMPMTEFEFYKQCQKVDEWPGENYDGTSLRASFKVLKRLGLLGEYRWAFDIEPMIVHLLTKGPMTVGTDWTADAGQDDRWGYIWFGGNSDGGHAYLIIGADRERKNPDGTKGAFRIVNSWGRGWAQAGRAWITFKEMSMLMKNYGEAAATTELTPVRVAA